MNKIVVIGSGPAGTSCAIGLKKLGYDVTVIYKNRPFNAIEGFSKRTLEGLYKSNCFNAIKALGEYLPRTVTWNKKQFQNNYEYIVYREEFDKALLKDLMENNIDTINAKAKILDTKKGEILVNDSIHTYDFIVDARGRFASKKSKYKSKPTSSFLVKYKKKNFKFQTSLSTSKYGWIWKASDGNDLNYLQLTTDTKFGKSYIKSLLKENGLSNKLSKLTVRESSSYISSELLKEKYIRIGDCACAVDPLSGNGVFQALSTALVSAYVINTLLKGSPEDKKAACRFYKKRVEDIFFRYTRMGREFYSKENQYKTKFWIDRSNWPDLKNSHTKIKKLYIAEGEVLDSPFIKSHEVIITNSNPKGVWKLNELNIVPLVKQIINISKNKRLDFLNSLCLEKNNQKNVEFWLKENGVCF